ncbi:hypothetical protein BX600DRAFT_429254 [Xylariales sp. PMI_506]|nr:hypothetical protein BX600DRAFT_429254 [Xylariales sp. PMI_506]
MVSDSAAGQGWYKICEEGKAHFRRGLMSIAIPEGFPTRHWLFRTELLALHDADIGNHQFLLDEHKYLLKASRPAPWAFLETDWCGIEVADYCNEDECWAASTACFDHAQTCYDRSPPTSYRNCKIWEAKCDGINDACDSGDFTGLPNEGVKSTGMEPEAPTSIPAAGNLGTRQDTESPSDDTSTAQRHR